MVVVLVIVCVDDAICADSLERPYAINVVALGLKAIDRLDIEQGAWMLGVVLRKRPHCFFAFFQLIQEHMDLSDMIR